MVLLLVIFFLTTILVSFTCSMMESILLLVTEPFIEAQASEGRDVRMLRKIKKNVDKSLSGILALNTIVNTIGSAGVGVQATKVFGDAYFGIVSACLTVLILIFGEIVPKTIGANYWRQLSVFSGYIIHFITYLMYPFIFLSRFITQLFTKGENTNAISREEVVALAGIGSREGVFEERESAVIQNIIHLKDKKVRDIMTPRTVVCSASEDTTVKELLEREEFLQHSRIPVYATSPDDITGYILKMNALEEIAHDNGNISLKEIKREMIVYYENFSVSGLLASLMQKKEHIALIVDEFGSIAGIATMEDVIETLLGLEIIDEHDTQIDMQQHAKMKWEERSQDIDI
ncbi:MAG: hemolysin family protein [Bacteroidales bacterium]|jgi:CBS domain containing-hemolysin-like protein|nr:hemolysin family protein [Bacteroidales bacterium]